MAGWRMDLSYVTILVADDGEVRTITLNRPERRNAMTPEMQVELIAAMEEAAVSSCRVVVLRGAGDAFCSGLDLAALQGMEDKSAAEHTADVERIGRLFRTLYELPKPTIAAVHGAAIAGGTGLATICDFTLAVPAAKFGYTEVRIGFVPAIVSAWLVRQIGEKAARDLLFTGRIVSADEALRIGLITEAVAPARLLERAHELALQLLKNSPASLVATKRLLNGYSERDLQWQLEAAIEANAAIRATEDFREGISSFLEKREPKWSAG